jgi:hypothetical protein
MSYTCRLVLRVALHIQKLQMHYLRIITISAPGPSTPLNPKCSYITLASCIASKYIGWAGSSLSASSIASRRRSEATPRLWYSGITQRGARSLWKILRQQNRSYYEVLVLRRYRIVRLTSDPSHPYSRPGSFPMVVISPGIPRCLYHSITQLRILLSNPSWLAISTRHLRPFAKSSRSRI